MADATKAAPARADGEDVAPEAGADRSAEAPASGVAASDLEGPALDVPSSGSGVPKVGQVVLYRPSDDDRRVINRLESESAGRVNETFEGDDPTIAVLVTGVRRDVRPSGHPEGEPGLDLVTGTALLDGSRADGAAATFPVRMVSGRGDGPGQWTDV